MTSEEMRERARRYRAMTTAIDDAQANKALLELADQYDALAEEVEAREPTLQDRAPDKENPT